MIASCDQVTDRSRVMHTTNGISMSQRHIKRSEIYRLAIRAAWVGLWVNSALAGVKLWAGLTAGTFALVADAVNSIGDALTSLAVLLALRYAQRPPDDDHPYGHSRVESIVATNVALLIIVSAVWVGFEAVTRITQSHPPPALWALIVAAINVVIKESVYHYKKSVGLATGSIAVMAAAWDHRADALCSLAVLIGLSIVAIGGDAWNAADEITALLVVGIIAWSGIRLHRSAMRQSLDIQADPALIQTIRDEASSQPGVDAIESLRVRRSGLEYFADIHVQIQRDQTIETGHEIGHAVKDHLLEKFPMVRDVLVHIEPTAPSLASSPGSSSASSPASSFTKT